MPDLFQFGVFEFDAAKGELRKQNTLIKLQPQPARLLRLLIENAGAIVNREQIQQSVWGADTIVDFELGVNRCIRQLRAALLDDAAAPLYIKTFPRIGYSFVAPLRTVSARLPEAPIPSDGGTRLSRRVPRAASLALAAGLTIGAGFWLWNTRHGPGMARDLEAVPLTSYLGIEFSPAFSPDGRQVAFVWNGNGQDNFDIYTTLIGSARSVRLTGNPAVDYSPAWSPDGRSIAFCRGTETPGGAVWIIPAIGGAERKLLDLATAAVPEVRSISWSPDGKWLAVSDTFQHRNRSLALVDVNSGRALQITHPLEGEDDMFPAFAPQGDAVAFTRETNRGYSAAYVMRLRPDGTAQSAPQPVDWSGFRGVSTLAPAWTPDGSSLVIQSIHDGRLWMGPARRDAEPRLLAALGEDASGPAISTRGQMAFVHSAFNTNIHKMRVGAYKPGQQPETATVIASTRTETSPAVSPDGRSLAFVSDRTGFTEIWTSQIDGTNPVQITFLRNASTGSPSWSPDGSQIAFDSRIKGEASIYAVAVTGGSPVQVTSFSGVIPVWSPDGKWIYFSSKHSGSMQVWRTPRAGGAPEQVTSSGGFAWKFSPDATYAYFLHDNAEHSDLLQRDFTNGKDRTIAESVFRRGFAPAKGGVYYLSGTTYGVLHLKLFDLPSHAITDESAIAAIDSRGVALSPDERYLFYSQIEHRSADLKLVEQFWK